MDVVTDSLVDQVLKLAEWGFHPVVVRARDKAPVGIQWGRHVSRDPDVIRRTFTGDCNVGVVLGPCHTIPSELAVIDIEDDSPEGRVLADTLLADCPAPCWSSGKSIHRIYRWTPDLEFGLASVRHGGIEFRLGGHAKETQSVAPPSTHPLGPKYQWIRTPDECPIQELPQHIRDWIRSLATAEKAQAHSASGGYKPLLKMVGDVETGTRHAKLLSLANHTVLALAKSQGINALDEPDAMETVWSLVAGASLLRCKEPKEFADTSVVVRSAFTWCRRKLAEETERLLNTPQEPATVTAAAAATAATAVPETLGAWLNAAGIRYRPDPRLESGEESSSRTDAWVSNWTLTISRSSGESDAILNDQEHLNRVLTIPGHPQIIVPLAGLRKPDVVAEAVLYYTQGRLALDRRWPDWSWKEIWLGRKNGTKGDEGITRGLLEDLESRCQTEDAPPDGEELSSRECLMDLVQILSGCSQDSLESACTAAHNQNRTIPENVRLRLDPVCGEILYIPQPHEKMTGWYLIRGQLCQLVKMNELIREYQASYRQQTWTKVVSAGLEKSGFQRVHIKSGPLAGRWWQKTQSENNSEKSD
jgi:hypothetical protein